MVRIQVFGRTYDPDALFMTQIVSILIHDDRAGMFSSGGLNE
jgi:hypothetical protein